MSLNLFLYLYSQLFVIVILIKSLVNNRDLYTFKLEIATLLLTNFAVLRLPIFNWIFNVGL